MMTVLTKTLIAFLNYALISLEKVVRPLLMRIKEVGQCHHIVNTLAQVY